MQTYYATHLSLASSGSGNELDVVVRALYRWIGRRFQVSLNPLAGGQASLNGTTVNWSMMTGVAGGLFGVWVDQPDTTEGGWRWRTYVDVGVQERKAWFRVRVHLYSTTEGLLTSPRVAAGRPGVVRQLVDELDINVDGQDLGSPLRVTLKNVDQYLMLLKQADRRLPIVALSTDEDGETFLDPQGTSDKLLGLAHVAVIDTDSSRVVTEILGKQLSCYRGAVRIYWPRMQTTDDPFHHRLFIGGALDFLQPEGLQQELFFTFGRLAGLTIDEPPLRRQLLLEKRETDLERSIQTRADALARLSRTSQSEGDVSADDFAQFAKEYDDLDSRLTSLDLDAVELQREVERVRQERDDARAALVELGRSYAQSRPQVLPAALHETPKTILDAVSRARSLAQHSVILDEALSSASESQFGDPARVLEDLQLIEEIARDWQTGELASGPHQAFKQRCSAYRDGIGQQASTRYKVDYEREWQDGKVMLGPHIARGVGSISTILRIYFYFDTHTKAIIVGHVGRKLRDESNRN